MLTKRQKQILDYITKYIQKNDYAPSLEEIKRYFKLSSVATIHQHIENLKTNGYLKKTENQPRSIELNKKQGKPELTDIPLLGIIAAGEPIEAIEERQTIRVLKSQLSESGKHYALRVNGDSMIDEGIFDGDIVIIRKQPTAENGETIVALINDSEVTLKKIYKEKSRFRLQPANSNIKPIFTKKLIVQGKVVTVIRNFNKLRGITTRLTKVKDTNNVPDSKQTLKKWINTIQYMDCVEGMKKLSNESIDLIVTSPPYDGIRKYNGFDYDLHAAGKEIYRILKDGGIAVMIIQDQTKNFRKSLTSFKTIIDWCDNVGFKLFETVIYKKHGTAGAWWTKRFRVDHEYMPIFLKGRRPQYFNKEPLKIPSKHGGKTMTGCATRLTNGKTLKSKRVTINHLKCRGTLWDYTTCGDGSRLKHKHPATFPDKIPFDFIQCFCPKKGIVLDPFVGSGTTALAAIELDRNYIGFDISKEYCDLAKKRIKEEMKKNRKLL